MTDTQPTIYVDNVKCRLAGVDKNTANLLSKAFALKVPNYWYSPKYKAGMWDGTYKFFVRPSNSFPTGLLPKVLDLLAEDYEIVPQIIDQRKDVNKYQLSQLSENYKISDVKTARDYQVDTLNKLITNNINGISFTRGVVNIATNGGKCQPLYANVVTEKGFTKIGDLHIGDYIYCEDGKKHKVLGIFDHESKDLYRVSFNDGTSTICCDEHLWRVQSGYDRKTHNYRVLELREINKHLYQGGKRPRPNWSIPVTSPVDFEYKSTAIDPWLLGFLIGDGIISHSVGFSNAEKDLIDRATTLIEALGDHVTKYKSSKYCDFIVVGNNLRTQLRKLGLYGCRAHEKFIPKEYLLNSVEVRTKLLQGLNDTDGYTDPRKSGYVEHSTASKQLSEDMKFLIQSLGGTVQIHERQGEYTKDSEHITTRTQYRIGERFFDISIVPVSSEKHLKKWLPRKKGLCKYITKIEYLSKDKARCIYVDNPSHLYLTDDFIVTHNTSIAIALIKELYPKLVENNANFLFVTHSKEIAVQAKKSIETDLGIEVGFIGDGKWDLKPVTVTIVTTLYRRMNKPEFKTLIDSVIGFVADECHHATSNSWYEVFNSFTNAQIRVGLTGTVDKANPINEMKLYSCTSEVINRISNEYLIENGYSAKPICVLFNVSEPNLEDEPYQVAYQLGIVDNDYRSDLIVRICKKETDANNVVLILVEHIEHGEIISERLKSLNKRVFFTNGQLDSETRQQLLDDLKNGNIDILISTAILDEGVDVSGINAIIYARGGKSTRKLLQGIGRGLRKKEDGSKLRFYDFIDDTSAHLLKHSLHRYETLEAENFTIKNFSIEDFEKMTLKEIENGTF